MKVLLFALWNLPKAYISSVISSKHSLEVDLSFSYLQARCKDMDINKQHLGHCVLFACTLKRLNWLSKPEVKHAARYEIVRKWFAKFHAKGFAFGWNWMKRSIATSNINSNMVCWTVSIKRGNNCSSFGYSRKDAGARKMDSLQANRREKKS